MELCARSFLGWTPGGSRPPNKPVRQLLSYLGRRQVSQLRRQETRTKSRNKMGACYRAPGSETEPIPPGVAGLTDLTDAQACQARHGTHKEGPSSTYPSQRSGRLRSGGLRGLRGNSPLHLPHQRLLQVVSVRCHAHPSVCQVPPAPPPPQCQVPPALSWQPPGWGFSYLC